MKVHILGNGPSNNLYTPQEGYIVGCNFQEYPVDVSVVLDRRPFLVYCGNRALLQGKPIITSKYAMKTINEQEILHEFEILHTIETLELYVSAGHVAVDWCLGKYDEIHLWGFDSIWSDTQETRSDKLIERSRAQFDLFIHWREKWQAYKQYNIIVHDTLEGTPLKDLI